MWVKSHTQKGYFLKHIPWETHGKGYGIKAVLSFFFFFFQGFSIKDVSWIPHIVEFHVPFNHQGEQMKVVFTDGSCLQSALNFLCPIEEMIFFGNATFDADG